MTPFLISIRMRELEDYVDEKIRSPNLHAVSDGVFQLCLKVVVVPSILAKL